MYLGESLTVIMFIESVEYDAQSNNTHECKSTWKQNLIRPSCTTSTISLVNSWALTLKENQKTTWFRNASSFSQSYYWKKPLCLKMFLGLNSGPEYNIKIWDNFEESDKLLTVNIFVLFWFSICIWNDTAVRPVIWAGYVADV